MPTALRAWEVIGSHIVSPDALTVLLYAHHDVQPVPDPAEWNTDVRGHRN
mgnify:CR=1 FL=1